MCTIVGADGCAGSHLHYLGDGSVCAAGSCVGACCDTVSGSCTVIALGGCAGAFRGDGTTCATANCAGACCSRVTGACSLSGPDGCAGTYEGDGSACAGTVCPFPGACGDCTWNNGVFDGLNGQASHLGGAIPNGAKAADDFYLCNGSVYDLHTITATLLTTTTQGLVKPKAELWADCDGCPGTLLYTFDKPIIVESGQTLGTAFDGRPLRVVHATFDVTQETTLANQNVVLKGGRYWLRVYGRTDGLCPSMNMCDVTYWGTTGGGNGVVKGKPAYKLDGTANGYNFNFPSGCGPGAWHSVTDDCCIGCTDLNFTVCTTPCKILMDNGPGRHQSPNLEPVGSTSQFASGLSAFDTRTADDFVVPPCCRWLICYAEGCVLTNCPTFDGVFEIYANTCNKPNYTLHGQCTAGPVTATKIIPLNYGAVMDGRQVSAYRLEFHDLGLALAGGSQYWVSFGVRYSFSLNERAYFCYNDSCGSSCLIRWNDGRVISGPSAQFPNGTIDFDSAAHGGNTPGWAKTGNDNAFLIAAERIDCVGGGSGLPPPPAPCAGDVNRDGVVNVQDIFDFLHGWFAGCP